MSPLAPCTTFDVRLVRTRELTRTVRELVFERTDGREMAFEPGQWVRLRLPVPVAHPQDPTRAYSIASCPDRTAVFELAVTRVEGGLASTWLHSATPGQVLACTGPQGFFAHAHLPPPPSLMIATGTGVAPLRSMIHAAVRSGSTAPMWLLLGVRREEDILYASEFQTLAKEHPFVRFEPTLSQGSPSWQGRRGYVQTHVRSLWEELSAHSDPPPHAYVCGLERMVGSVRNVLRKELGLQRPQVHSERYD